jgi:hypothetical protein
LIKEESAAPSRAWISIQGSNREYSSGENLYLGETGQIRMNRTKYHISCYVLIVRLKSNQLQISRFWAEKAHPKRCDLFHRLFRSVLPLTETLLDPDFTIRTCEMISN